MTDLILISIALIVFAFLFRWYARFVDSQIEYRDRRLREVKIAWLDRCYAVDKEDLDRIRYKQIMDDKYSG
jgi:hypothetical protein